MARPFGPLETVSYWCPSCGDAERLGTLCGCGLKFTETRRSMPHYITALSSSDASKLRWRLAGRLTHSLPYLGPTASRRASMAKSLEGALAPLPSDPDRAARVLEARRAVGLSNPEHVQARIAQLRRVGFTGPWPLTSEGNENV